MSIRTLIVINIITIVPDVTRAYLLEFSEAERERERIVDKER